MLNDSERQILELYQDKLTADQLAWALAHARIAGHTLDYACEQVLQASSDVTQGLAPGGALSPVAPEGLLPQTPAGG